MSDQADSDKLAALAGEPVPVEVNRLRPPPLLPPGTTVAELAARIRRLGVEEDEGLGEQLLRLFSVGEGYRRGLAVDRSARSGPRRPFLTHENQVAPAEGGVRLPENLRNRARNGFWGNPLTPTILFSPSKVPYHVLFGGRRIAIMPRGIGGMSEQTFTLLPTRGTGRPVEVLHVSLSYPLINTDKLISGKRYEFVHGETFYAGDAVFYGAEEGVAFMPLSYEVERVVLPDGRRQFQPRVEGLVFRYKFVGRQQEGLYLGDRLELYNFDSQKILRPGEEFSHNTAADVYEVLRREQAELKLEWTFPEGEERRVPEGFQFINVSTGRFKPMMELAGNIEAGTDLDARVVSVPAEYLTGAKLGPLAVKFTAEAGGIFRPGLYQAPLLDPAQVKAEVLRKSLPAPEDFARQVEARTGDFRPAADFTIDFRARDGRTYRSVPEVGVPVWGAGYLVIVPGEGYGLFRFRPVNFRVEDRRVIPEQVAGDLYLFSGKEVSRQVLPQGTVFLGLFDRNARFLLRGRVAGAAVPRLPFGPASFGPGVCYRPPPEVLRDAFTSPHPGAVLLEERGGATVEERTGPEAILIDERRMEIGRMPADEARALGLQEIVKLTLEGEKPPPGPPEYMVPKKRVPEILARLAAPRAPEGTKPIVDKTKAEVFAFVRPDQVAGISGVTDIGPGYVATGRTRRTVEARLRREAEGKPRTRKTSAL